MTRSVLILTNINYINRITEKAFYKLQILEVYDRFKVPFANDQRCWVFMFRKIGLLEKNFYLKVWDQGRQSTEREGTGRKKKTPVIKNPRLFISALDVVSKKITSAYLFQITRE